MDSEKASYNRALRDLRERTPGLSDDGKFARTSGLHPGIIAGVRRKEDYLPELPTIRKWVEACGTTLSRFFASVESSNDGDTVDIPVKRDNLVDHEKLETLLSDPDPKWLNLARGNVDAVHLLYETEKTSKSSKKK